MTIKLNLHHDVVLTGRAVCDHDPCRREIGYAGTIRTEGMALTDPDMREEGGGPLPLKCPFCRKGVLRYQK